MSDEEAEPGYPKTTGVSEGLDPYDTSAVQEKAGPGLDSAGDCEYLTRRGGVCHQVMS